MRKLEKSELKRVYGGNSGKAFGPDKGSAWCENHHANGNNSSASAHSSGNNFCHTTASSTNE